MAVFGATERQGQFTNHEGWLYDSTCFKLRPARFGEKWVVSAMHSKIIVLVIGLLIVLIALFLVFGIKNDARLSKDQFMAQFRASFGGKGSNAFVPLTDQAIERHFEGLVEALLTDDLTAAYTSIAALDNLGVRYKLVRVTGGNNGGEFLAFMERVIPGEPDYHGWGTIVVRPLTQCNKVYQAPHVRSDEWTEEITLRAFIEDPQACAAMFAGTNRYANGTDKPISDVAHATQNLFHALTGYLARRGQSNGSPYWFIQLHGSMVRQNEPDIIGANGQRESKLSSDSPLVRIYQDVNTAGNVRMGVCGWKTNQSETDSYDLCATGNVQGQLLEQLGLRQTFMHFEMSQSVRNEYHAGAGPGYTGILSLLKAIKDVGPPQAKGRP